MNSSHAPSTSDARVDGSCSGTGVFYLVVTPGFEAVAARELRDWYAEAQPAESRGGLEVTLPLGVGLELNRVLKTPTRVLLRLADFGCRDFPKLFKKISNFPWGDWITDDTVIDFQASTHDSRLRIKKRIEETCADGRRNYLKKKAAGGDPGGKTQSEKTGASRKQAALSERTVIAEKPKSLQGESQAKTLATVFVRFQDDVCFVSLDTSGELLHKRGLRPLSSDAPLRETLAASLLLMMMDDSGEANSGAKAVQLVDPMTGGGTFLLEARDLNRRISSRNYAFESFQPLLARVGEWPQLAKARANPCVSFIGFDSDEKALASARENLGSISDSRPVDLRNEDFLKASSLPGETPRWLIANPPYGERIQVKGKLSDFYTELLTAAERVARPEKACFIFPEKASPKRLQLPQGWRVLGEHRFLNGGLPVFAMIYGRSR